jgi:heme oxygenase (biliverdin-IX-beta and delta-forming)
MKTAMLGGDREARDEGLLANLRSATGKQHAALDAIIGPAVARSKASYARFLLGSFEPASAVEGAVERALGADFRAIRCPALRADLEDLGEEPPPAAEPLHLTGEAEAIGAAYVLEGSALGGIVLAARVRDALGDAVPTRYLLLRGREASARWRWFLGEIRRFDGRWSEATVAAACAGAMRAFDLYAGSFQRHAAGDGAWS